MEMCVEHSSTCNVSMNRNISIFPASIKELSNQPLEQFSFIFTSSSDSSNVTFNSSQFVNSTFTSTIAKVQSSNTLTGYSNTSHNNYILSSVVQQSFAAGFRESFENRFQTNNTSHYMTKRILSGNGTTLDHTKTSNLKKNLTQINTSNIDFTESAMRYSSTRYLPSFNS